MKRWMTWLLALALCLSALIPVAADTAAGDTVAIMGADLSDEERDTLLKEFGATEDTVMLTITNAEEHEALGDLIPAGQIGTHAISSVMITFRESGAGLNIRMSHITYVTPQSYADALVTLGITDADIIVSAPYDVSGTAALTGIMKGFEQLTGEKIDEDVKEAVNEEALLSINISEELSNELGDEDAQQAASDIISDIKVAIDEEKPQTQDDIERIVREVLEKHKITISDDLFNRIVALFNKMKDLNIDWSKVADNIEKGANQLFNNIMDSVNSEEARGFFQKIADWFVSLWDWIKSWFD